MPRRATGRAAGAVLALSAALAVVAAGCTRPRHGAAPPTPALERTAAAPAAGASPLPTAVTALRIVQPVPDADVGSPVRVVGTIRPQDGRVYVAQVVVAGAQPEVRGNTRVDVGASNGTFSVDVPYVLDAPADGTVQIVVVDPVGGTVGDTASVPVRLAAAP